MPSPYAVIDALLSQAVVAVHACHMHQLFKGAPYNNCRLLAHSSRGVALSRIPRNPEMSIDISAKVGPSVRIHSSSIQTSAAQTATGTLQRSALQLTFAATQNYTCGCGSNYRVMQVLVVGSICQGALFVLVFEPQPCHVI